MPERIAIHLTDEIIAATQGYELVRSARLNQLAAEWLLVMRANEPSLTDAERSWLQEIAPVEFISDGNIRRIRAALEETRGACAARGIDCGRLDEKLRALNLAQGFALRESLERRRADAGK